MATTNFKTRGVCAREIAIDTQGDIITDVKFIGGCDGNLKAISQLIKGRNIHEIADILEGNICGRRDTSCADQLSKALRTIDVE